MMNLVPYVPLIIKGTSITMTTWILSGTMSLCIGSFFGIISCHHLALRRCAFLVRLYTFIAKGIPAYVQILIAYFIIPSLFGITMSGLAAGTMALAFCSSGYITEIIRASINAISRDQWDACFVLGYPLSFTLSRIIVPQAIKIALPSLMGELEQLLKSTSLLATIGITELTRTGMNIISRELNPLPVYLIVASIYLLFSAMLNVVIVYIERKNGYHYH